MFRHLVSRHEASLLAFLVGRLDDREEAAEAAQESFVRAYFALSQLKRPAAFSSWLMGIADHVAKEALRRRRRSPRQSEAAGIEQVEARPEVLRPGRSLARAVAALPEPQRQVILMKFYGGQSCGEIAAHLGLSVGTVTSRLSRAYGQLREALREADSEEEHHS